MSDLKFSCPACGQHVQCDEAHAGENIPCPSCAHLVRVPLYATVVAEAPKAAVDDNPFAHDESKVSYTTTHEVVETPAKQVPTLEENFSGNAPAPEASSAPLTEREQEIAAAHHPKIEAMSSVKPRLSFILSGGAAPAPEDNEKALSPEQKKLANPEKSPSEVKTFHE